MPYIDSSLSACLALIAVWGLIGLAGLLRPRSLGFVARTLFPLGALCGLALAVVAATSLASTSASRLSCRFGLPDLPMHVRRDALTSLFLFLLGITSAGISVFAAGYFRRGQGTPPGLLCLQYHLFLASMGVVLLADDAYAFMVAWETMALSSYFLVTAQHAIPEIRRAGFLYLLIAHIGAIAILLSFGVMQGGSWKFTFDAMRSAHLAPQWGAIAFLLALLGFGAKAGLVPLHVWLPEAHPAAPSPVSALMSGVMLKTAVYGVLRVTFDLLGTPAWWWGLVLLATGLFSALYGVIFAAAQTDMKRLLAWSSIENLGIIFTGIGLAVVFNGVGMYSLGALALIAALYHSLNHAFMKSLLFLGTGAGPALNRRAQPGTPWRPDPSHAVGCLAYPRRCAGDGWAAASERLRFRVAPAAGIPLRPRSAPNLRQHDACRSAPRWSRSAPPSAPTSWSSSSG